jgi:hypothetical protein
VSRRSEILALVSLLLPAVASAHLRPPGQSLLRLLAESDAVVVAEVVDGTRDDRDEGGRLLRSETALRLVRTLAGSGPTSETFRLEAAPPALRYAAGQNAIVLLARANAADRAERWRAVQSTGAGLVLDRPLAADAAAALASLWDAARHPTHGGAPSDLERLVDAAPRKLAMMAALDLADLAHEGRLPPDTARSLRDRLSDPALAPELRPILEHAVADRNGDTSTSIPVAE